MLNCQVSRFPTSAITFIQNSSLKKICTIIQLHYKIDSFILGDLTEDPQHPKSLWPSVSRCPECRPNPWTVLSNQRNMMITFEGQLWNIEATANYLMKVYGNDNIVRNSIHGLNDERIPLPEKLRSSEGRKANFTTIEYSALTTSSTMAVPVLADRIDRGEHVITLITI